MNANEIYHEKAVTAYELATGGEVDNDTATALLEMAKVAALLAIEDSLFELVEIKRGNEKPAGVE